MIIIKNTILASTPSKAKAPINRIGNDGSVNTDTNYRN
jgi:hypothetical protein